MDYNCAGTGRNPTFGNGGVVVTQVAGQIQAHSIALQPDGKIVVGGKRTSDLAFVFSVARYKPDGTLDESFGSGGMISRPNDDLSEAVEILIQPDAKIVAISSVFPDTEKASGICSNRPPVSRLFSLERRLTFLFRMPLCLDRNNYFLI